MLVVKFQLEIRSREDELFVMSVCRFLPDDTRSV